jgi:hypothetical protein
MAKVTVTVRHADLTGADANPNVLVDGPKWDADHPVTGLENIDDTADADKPISDATQTALDAKQPLDADLTAIAALTTATYGRSLLTLADAAALAAEFDAVYQPLDADLTAIAGLADPNADRILFWDDSAGAYKHLTAGSGLTITDTTITASGSGSLVAPQCRLTLTSALPVTTSDVTGATSVYMALAGGNQIPVYDGASFSSRTFTQQTLALDSDSGHTNYHQADKNYDYFYADVAGVLYFGTGPKWDDGAVAGSDTARGTGAASTELENYLGWYVNKNSMTLRHGSASGNTVTVPARQATYLGTGRMTANGTTEDSLAKRFLWNAYNQVKRPMKVSDATVSWSYNTSTFRQFRATATNQIAFVLGLVGLPVDAMVFALPQISAGTSYAVVGIGLDSTSVNQNYAGGFAPITTISTAMSAEYNGHPGLGYHILVPLEYGPGAGTVTWFGTDGSPFRWNTGIFGNVWA